MLNIDKMLSVKNNLSKSNLSVLNSLIRNNKLHKTEVPNVAGIYAFWWTGDREEFIQKIKESNYELKGKKTELKPIEINFDAQWLHHSTHEDKICLYIGKTTDLRNRASKHLKLNTDDIWKPNEISFGNKPNSESQLRIGLERIFKTEMRDRIKSDVSITWMEFPKNENCINRFYAENLAIGYFFPLFNIDIER